MKTSGYILLEVLMASALSALLSISLIGIFEQLNSAVKRADDTMDICSTMLRVLSVMQRDLSGACIPMTEEAKKADAAEKEKKASQEEERTEKKEVDIKPIFEGRSSGDILEQLTFLSNNPLKIYWRDTIGHAQPSLVRIMYRLEPEKNKKSTVQSYRLMRQESSTLEVKAFADTETIHSYELARGVKSMKITYLPRPEKEGEEAQPAKEWKLADDEADEVHTKLPKLVTITLSLWHADHKRSRDITFSVLLLAEAFTPIETPSPETPPAPTTPAESGTPQPVPDIFTRLGVPQMKPPVEPPKQTSSPSVLSKMRHLMTGVS